MESATQPAAAGAPERGSDPAQPWSDLHRFAFRFAGAYLMVYAVHAIALATDTGSTVYSLVARYTAAWQAVTAWVGLRIFDLTTRQTGSLAVGDGMAQWIQNLCQLVIALSAAVVWSMLDRRRPHYRSLHGWLRLLIRYVLAYVLFSYGFSKLFPLQFKPTAFSEMMTPYGEFTRMNVLWTFMGASQLYTVVTGAVEVAGAALLLFRRTTALGALLLLVALLNVFLLNVAYNVNVKIYSLNLLLMAAFLLVSEVKPLADVLVFHRATVPAPNLEPVFHRRSLRLAATATWILVTGSMLYHHIGGSWLFYKHYFINPERPPLLGLYDVQSFSRSGQELPPLTTDKTRWYRVSFDPPWSGRGPGYTHVRMMDGVDIFRRSGGIRCEFDEAASSVTLIHSDEGGRVSKEVLRYSRPDPDHVLLQGRLGVAWRRVAGSETDSVSILLRKIDTAAFPILRPTRWILGSR
jgi:uncharacterized membrane protein YphA (DoxX/SURF4 family)